MTDKCDSWITNEKDESVSAISLYIVYIAMHLEATFMPRLDRVRQECHGRLVLRIAWPNKESAWLSACTLKPYRIFRH